MSYWNNRLQNVSSIENFGLGKSKTGGTNDEFYELEPAIVLDVILDKNHPFFKQSDNLQINIDPDRWPGDFNNKKSLETDVDYTWIGRVLVRMMYSSPTTQKERLVWAIPMDSSISEYPVINEVVIIMRYRNIYFYTRKVNIKNLPNDAVDFSINKAISGKENNELYTDEAYKGVESKTSYDSKSGYTGVSGKYYKINSNVRRVKRYEGDTIIEGRFGNTITFRAYDDNRENDIGYKKYPEYFNGGGNPMILIRNRQRKLLNKNESLKLSNSPNPATISGTDEEKNAGGYIDGDINHDGSSIYITSGLTESKWVTTCYKKMFGVDEEVSKFKGKSFFVYPKLWGDQIIINTDRLILSSRYGETFHYSKKRYSIVTDSECSIDSHDQIVMTTNVKTVINSPAIYLGEYDQTGEPALLGQTTVSWLYDLCNWLLEHTHWYIHSHVDAGKESPSQTQLPVQVQRLISLRDKLHTLMSRRVFLTGGGFAPGQNGGKITDGVSPVNINVSSGGGVPGGWRGANKR